jgi:rRNA maturation endonuclease Nob1
LFGITVSSFIGTGIGVVFKLIYKNMYLLCPKCKEVNRGDLKFCSSCGKRITGFETEVKK